MANTKKATAPQKEEKAKKRAPKKEEKVTGPQLPENKAGETEPEKEQAGNVGENADGVKPEPKKPTPTKPEPKEQAGKINANVTDTKNAEEAQIIHNTRVKYYGQGYVVARKGKNQQVFTAKTWKNMGAGHGWEPVTGPELPEVAALKKEKGTK